MRLDGAFNPETGVSYVTRLQLVWPNKDKFLLSPTDEDGKPVWVEPSHPAAQELRLTEFTGDFGQVWADPYADNLLFTGDSLDVLKVLARTPEYARDYRGRVKLVYLDPPFNTGQTFEHYDDWMEHSTWLSFMRERLLIAKELLATDGSIWIHLDDAEQHRMRLLMDEVFGGENFIATVIWHGADIPKSSARYLSTDQDYVLVYARNRAQWSINKLARDDDGNTNYKNPDNDPRGPWMSGPITATKPYSKGRYAIVGPKGDEFYPTPNTWWRFSEEKFHQLNAEGRIYWGKNGDGRPLVKRYLSEVGDLVPRTIWPYQAVGSTRNAKAEMKRLFGTEDTFATPKPERLMQRIIHIGSNPGDIVLDVFAGSGTTAAVAQKMGRRWVTGELSADNVSKFVLPRLEKVIAGEDAGGITEDVEWKGGGGFRTVTLAPSAYVDTPLGVMFEDWVGAGDFARLVTAQLGFTYEEDGPFCGRRGRMRLMAIFGGVGVEEAAVALSALETSERVTIVGTVILDGAEQFVKENSRGSRVLKAPRDVLRPSRARKRSQ